LSEKGETYLKYIKILIVIVCFAAVGDKLNAENYFIAELSNGYNSNVKEEYNKISSAYTNLFVSEDYSFEKIPISFSIMGENTFFHKSDLNNRFILNGEVSYDFSFWSITLGDYLFIDNNEHENSFNGVFGVLSWKYKKYIISYTYMKKFFTSRYEYGNYKDFFLYINKNIKKNKKNSFKGSKSPKNIFNSKKHQKDDTHTLSVDFDIKNLTVSPRITYNLSNIDLEEYISGAIDFTFFTDFKGVFFTLFLNPSYTKYEKLDRKDFQIYSKLSVDYYFSDFLYSEITVDYKKNNSNLKNEDFSGFSSCLLIGINF
jgi:hypothetical protein